MKKFSKILSRRRARGLGDGNDSDPESMRLGPGLGPPSDFYQLPSRRGLGYGQSEPSSSGPGTPTAGTDGGVMMELRIRRRLPRPGSARIESHDGTWVPCALCSRIDFPARLDWRPGHGRPWIPLLHALRAGEEGKGLGFTGGEVPLVGADGSMSCPFCVFFQTVMGVLPGVGMGKSSPYMRIRLAFEKLGGGDKHELSKSVLVEVTSGSRTLPWGYIVKAENDEFDMRRYLEGTAAQTQHSSTEKEQAGDGSEKQNGAVGKTTAADDEVKNGNDDLMSIKRQEEKDEQQEAKEGAVGSAAEDNDDKSQSQRVATSAKQNAKADTAATQPDAQQDHGTDQSKPGTAAPDSKAKSTPTIDPPAASIRGRRISPLLDPALPRLWLDFCKTHHNSSACAGRDTHIVPGLKLIDCQNMTVVSADSVKADRLEYTTLSYVWGEKLLESHLFDQSTVASEDIREPHSLPAELPPLISDALAFTTSIGLRYIWIDRYCFSGLEISVLRRQVELMGDIYAASALTLVVAAGDGVRQGIPGVSVRREEQLSLTTSTGTYITSLLRPDMEVASSKWASRAWTYQEGLLSRRRLVFTPSQLYFQCQSFHCHETISLPLRLAGDLNLGRVFPAGGIVCRSGTFKNQVEAYMPRALTFSRDRLSAFRGVLAQYANAGENPVNHFLGLPLFHPGDFRSVKVVSETDRLAVGLAWMPDRTLPSQDQVDPYHFIEDSFPSWTWLSWRLRAGHGIMNNMFHFNLVGDESPIVDGVCAVPGMEISIGFEDKTVVSWEIDGDAIARKAEPVAFLRIETYCFDLKVKRQNYSVSVTEEFLDPATKEAVEAWVRNATLGRPAAVAADTTKNDTVAEGSLAGDAKTEEQSANDTASETLDVTCVLVSGRNWKTGAKAEASVLVCARQGWDATGNLIRLGVISIIFDNIVVMADKNAVLKGVVSSAEERHDVEVHLRELDLY